MASKSYQGHISYFGSPEAYAEAIKAKLSSGQRFSDLPAALEFQRDYPQYFTSGERLVPVRSTLESKGFEVTYSPDTGEATIAHPDNPYAYRYTFKPTYVVAGTSYLPESRIQVIEQRVTPTYQKTYTELSGMAGKLISDLSNMTTSYINSINNMIQQYGDAGLAMLKAYQEQYSQALAQMQQLMQPQKDVPESVKLAIQLLKEQTDENLKALDEEMIRRGIYRSGIAADMMQKMRKGQLEQEQQILAQWLDQQHQQMYNAALQYAKMQADYAGNLASLYQFAYMKPLELGLQAAQTAYQLQAGLAEKAFDISKSLRTWLAEQQQAAQAAALQHQADLAKQQLDWLKAQIAYQLDAARLAETQRWHDLQYGLQSAIQSELSNLRRLEAERIADQLATNRATRAAIADVLAKARTADEAYDQLQKNLSAFRKQGVDISEVLQAIKQRFEPSELAYGMPLTNKASAGRPFAGNAVEELLVID